MSGVKGRSGRKPNIPKQTQTELRELSHYVLQDALQSPATSQADKVRIALVLYPHYIPAKQEIQLSAQLPERDRQLLDRVLPEAIKPSLEVKALPAPQPDSIEDKE